MAPQGHFPRGDVFVPQAVDGPESAQPLGHGIASSLAPSQHLQANVDVTVRSFYSGVAI